MSVASIDERKQPHNNLFFDLFLSFRKLDHICDRCILGLVLPDYTNHDNNVKLKNDATWDPDKKSVCHVRRFSPGCQHG